MTLGKFYSFVRKVSLVSALTAVTSSGLLLASLFISRIFEVPALLTLANFFAAVLIVSLCITLIVGPIALFVD